MRALNRQDAPRAKPSSTEAALCPCNVCGGKEFGYGPSRRLSVSGRLPHCLTCSSLERHRIAYRVFEALSPKYTRAKRLLQFSPDPGVDPQWFEEMVVSVWGGENSLDMQRIDLPSGRYDWVYSSHVLNHVPNPSAALSEMLRVVGPHGVVTLSVGGTVTKYRNSASERMFGADRQFIVYGSQFADDILAVLPQVAVLELVGVDDSTGSLDSIYLYSLDEPLLQDMAQQAAGRNIHGRVFQRSKSTSASVPPSVLTQAPTVQSAAVAQVPPLAPCNICGGHAFDVGPNGRTSMGNRLPLCENCFSLERHRISQRIMEMLIDQLEGKRFLHFGGHLRPTKLGVAEAVSVGPRGDVMMDAMALDFPACRFDWVYSSHLLNNVADHAQALREMFRVVGPDGVVALSVGRSTAAPKPGMATPAPRLFSDSFATEVHHAIPEAGVIEVALSDPSTGALDALYLCSLNERTLTRIASSMSAQAVPVKRTNRTPQAPLPAPRAPSAEGSHTLDRLWLQLHEEVQSWVASSGRAAFWLRDDDVGDVSPALVSLVNLCERENVPLGLAAIPTRIRPRLVELVRSASAVHVLVHGYDHRNRGSSARPSEFPPDRSVSEVLPQLKSGLAAVRAALGENAFPVFVPPWGTCAAAVREALPQLGFRGFSGSPVGAFQTDALWRRGKPRTKEGLFIANAHVAVNRKSASNTSPFPAARIVAFLTRLVKAIREDSTDNAEPIGVMTHDWGVDPEIEEFLKQLFDVTRYAGAQWVSTPSLFDERDAHGS